MCHNSNLSVKLQFFLIAIKESGNFAYFALFAKTNRNFEAHKLKALMLLHLAKVTQTEPLRTSCFYVKYFRSQLRKFILKGTSYDKW